MKYFIKENDINSNRRDILLICFSQKNLKSVAWIYHVICYFRTVTESLEAVVLLSIMRFMKERQSSYLTLSWRRPLSYRNQTIDLRSNKRCSLDPYLSHANFHFYTPWKHQKISGCLTFSGDLKIENSPEMDQLLPTKLNIALYSFVKIDKKHFVPNPCQP